MLLCFFSLSPYLSFSLCLSFSLYLYLSLQKLNFFAPYCVSMYVFVLVLFQFLCIIYNILLSTFFNTESQTLLQSERDIRFIHGLTFHKINLLPRHLPLLFILLIEQKGMTFDHEFGYSFPFFLFPPKKREM